MITSSMLLVCTDDALIGAVCDAAQPIGHLSVEPVAGVDEALDRLRCGGIALVLVHAVEGDDGADASRLLREMAAGGRSVPTLVLSDRHRPEQALALLQQGALDYLSRPLDLIRLAHLADTLTLRARLVGPPPAPAGARVERLGEEEPFLYDPTSPMGRMMEQIRRVAPQDATILLGGETGTGKTRIARLIHDLSARRDEPFLAINCGALSATLIESEMFGHVKGAFTGADRDRTGKFAEVGRGTLFLDEVDSLPLTLQAKLLRAVEERVFEPVGSNRTQPVRARLIAASNRPLDREAAAGRFRLDLYYRLNVVAFELPPLRERRVVVPELARTLVAEFAGRAGREIRGLAPEALRALEAHDWPGNIRELRNVIERAVALSQGDQIRLDDLPEALQAAAPATPAPAPAPAATVRADAPTLSQSKETAERSRILEALSKHGNNRLRAAAELGVSRMTLYKKLHKYGMMTI